MDRRVESTPARAEPSLAARSAASIRAMTSGVSFGTTSSAFMFSATCAGRLAPVITVDTCGFLRHHASDICASVQPRSRGDRREPLDHRDLRRIGRCARRAIRSP